MSYISNTAQCFLSVTDLKEVDSAV